MQTKITDKYQITIPKNIRDKLKLRRNDIINWQENQGKIVITKVKKPFLELKGYFKTGKGNIQDDLMKARLHKVEKYIK